MFFSAEIDQSNAVQTANAKLAAPANTLTKKTSPLLIKDRIVLGQLKKIQSIKNSLIFFIYIFWCLKIHYSS